MIPLAKKKMFWTSGCWIDFILNILLELNVFQDLAMLPGPILTLWSVLSHQV